jgi:hypothetical protein
LESSDSLYVIRTFASDLDARLAEAVLEAHGIESIVISDNASGMLPYLNSLHPIRLAVKQSDVELAVSLLDSNAQSGG